MYVCQSLINNISSCNRLLNKRANVILLTFDYFYKVLYIRRRILAQDSLQKLIHAFTLFSPLIVNCNISNLISIHKKELELCFI